MRGGCGYVGKERTVPTLSLGSRVKDELYSMVFHSVSEVIICITAIVLLCYSLIGYSVVVVLAIKKIIYIYLY